jgi:hypothetical protein
VALTEWLARFPEFRLDPDAPMTWSKGTVRGPRELPLLLGARQETTASRDWFDEAIV